MNKKKVLYIIVGLLIVIVAIRVWILIDYWEDKEYKLEKGRIEVVFKPNVTEEKAREIISSYNCTVKSFFALQDGSLDFIVGVPSGQEEEYVEIFKADPNVYEAELIWEDK